MKIWCAAYVDLGAADLVGASLVCPVRLLVLSNLALVIAWLLACSAKVFLFFIYIHIYAVVSPVVVGQGMSAVAQMCDNLMCPLSA